MHTYGTGLPVGTRGADLLHEYLKTGGVEFRDFYLEVSCAEREAGEPHKSICVRLLRAPSGRVAGEWVMTWAEFTALITEKTQP